MALPPKFSFFILLPTIIFLSLPSSLLSHSTAPSVYELLPKYALPSGLLPSSVKSYSLCADDGRFVVELQKPCYVQFDDYLIYYEDRVTGRLRYGSITELKGIKVRRFFIWLSVDEIMVDLPPSDSIYFQVGLINKKLDIDQFKAVHSCRDDKGIYCVTSWKDLFQAYFDKGNGGDGTYMSLCRNIFG